MANRNSKAKQGADTMLGRKYAKLQERYNDLEARATQAHMSVLNLRQMYEGAIQEKQALTAQLQRVNTILIALVSQARGKTLTVKQKTLEKVTDFAGVETITRDGDLILKSLTVEEVQAMQDDIDEILDEDDDS